MHRTGRIGYCFSLGPEGQHTRHPPRWPGGAKGNLELGLGSVPSSPEGPALDSTQAAEGLEELGPPTSDLARALPRPLRQGHKGAMARALCSHLHEEWGEEEQRAPVRLQEPQLSCGLSPVMSSGHEGDHSKAREGLPLKRVEAWPRGCPEH